MTHKISLCNDWKAKELLKKQWPNPLTIEISIYTELYSKLMEIRDNTDRETFAAYYLVSLNYENDDNIT